MKNYQYLNYDELLNVFNHQDKSEKIEEAIFHEIIELYLKNNQLESNENIEKIEEEGLVQIDGKYYNLNITTLSITTISLIIDILFTNGMLQVGLSGLGIIKPFLERVNTKNGELCVFKNFETGYNYSMVTEKLRRRS